jgi:hypothetical protein
MRNVPELLAHLFERAGLALVGAAAGLFVGIQTGASLPPLTNPTFLLVVTIVGAIGFYLGIDTPPHRFQGITINLPGNRLDGRIDVSELLTAIGTFLAALAAFISVALIVLVLDMAQAAATALLATWGLGALIQVVAGTVARWRE